MHWSRVVIIAVVASSAAALTSEQVTVLKQECDNLINTNPTFIAGFVRLAFHDCVGGCDGCINRQLTGTNGDQPNAGLAVYVNALEDVYDNDAVSNTQVSRADFWATCAERAVQKGRQLANPGSLDVPITLNFGRLDDCGNRGFNTRDDHLSLFPDPRAGLSAVKTWCQTTFGFNERECVALLGAHTLGRTRAGASGYTGPWTTEQGPNHLNNRYFVEMNDIGIWSQEDVADSPVTDGDQRWQYRDDQRPPQGRRGRVPRPRIMMLNADICLVKNINPDTNTGRVVDELTTISNSSTRVIVEEYVASNELWIAEFGAVFTKMIENTNDPLSSPS